LKSWAQRERRHTALARRHDVQHLKEAAYVLLVEVRAAFVRRVGEARSPREADRLERDELVAIDRQLDVGKIRSV
jgi:hypothetical protein